MRISDFIQWFRAALANAFFQTVISKPGEGENTADVVLMAGEEGTETQQLTRLEQFGDVCCPPGSRTQCMALTNGAQGFAMSLCDPSTRPTDGKPGDRGLYSNQAGTRVHLYGAGASEPGLIRAENANGAQTLLHGDGTVNVNSNTGAGKDIILNGGTHQVIRSGGVDGVDAGRIFVQNTSSGMTDILEATYTSADPQDPDYGIPKTFIKLTLPSGSVNTPASGDSISIDLTGVPTRGAQHVKA